VRYGFLAPPAFCSGVDLPDWVPAVGRPDRSAVLRFAVLRFVLLRSDTLRALALPLGLVFATLLKPLGVAVVRPVAPFAGALATLLTAPRSTGARLFRPPVRLLSANSLPRSAPSLASRICALARKSEAVMGSILLAPVFACAVLPRSPRAKFPLRASGLAEFPATFRPASRVPPATLPVSATFARCARSR
jgi:hypothetical protein